MAFRSDLVQSAFPLQSSRFRAKGYWKAVRTVSRWRRAEVVEFCQSGPPSYLSVSGDWVNTALFRYGSIPRARFIRSIESRLNWNFATSRPAALRARVTFLRSATR